MGIRVDVVPRQGFDKGHDGVLVLIRRFPAQLELEHDIDGFAQGLGVAVVQIRGGMGGHAQARHLEGVSVGSVAGDIEASEVGLGDVAPLFEVVVNHAEDLEHVAADIRPLVARHTAVVFEQGVALFLVGAESLFIAGQPAVEAAVRGGQRLDELGDGFFDGIAGNRVFSVEIDLLEQSGILVVLVEFGHHVGPQAAHLKTALYRAVSLVWQRMRASVPELFEIEARVEHSGRVHRAPLSLNPGGHDLSVIAAGAEIVTTGARDAVVLG